MKEPDAKLMLSGRDGMIVGYNVQSAVDAGSGLIIHHEVMDGWWSLTALSDGAENESWAESRDVRCTGRWLLLQWWEISRMWFTVALPSRRSINEPSDGYPVNAFTYESDQNCYIYAAGERLRHKTVTRKEKRNLYAREGSHACAFKQKCTKAKKHWVSRHFHKDGFGWCEARLQQNPALMRQRMAIVERPFAILK
jgi:hypothetical protein